MPISHFWAANLAVHGPAAALFFLFTFIPEDKRMLSPSRKQGDEAALRYGLPYRLVRFTSTFQHLTVCTHCLSAAYLVAACLGQRAVARVLREVLGPAGAVVGVGFWALAITSPWNMFPRGDFPADHAAAERAVGLLLRPSLRMPQAAIYALLQALGPICVVLLCPALCLRLRLRRCLLLCPCSLQCPPSGPTHGDAAPCADRGRAVPGGAASAAAGRPVPVPRARVRLPLRVVEPPRLLEGEGRAPLPRPRDGMEGWLVAKALRRAHRARPRLLGGRALPAPVSFFYPLRQMY